jgi:hypothetical protein
MEPALGAHPEVLIQVLVVKDGAATFAFGVKADRHLHRLVLGSGMHRALDAHLAAFAPGHEKLLQVDSGVRTATPIPTECAKDKAAPSEKQPIVTFGMSRTQKKKVAKKGE